MEVVVGVGGVVTQGAKRAEKPLQLHPKCGCMMRSGYQPANVTMWPFFEAATPGTSAKTKPTMWPKCFFHHRQQYNN